MRLVCSELNLQIEIDEALIKQLHSIGMEHYPQEHGGLLVGNYTSDQKTCVVTNTVLPESYQASGFHFERGQAGIKEKLEMLYNSQARSVYLGEWHTHPNGNVLPSKTDKSAMIKICQHAEVLITCPILLILAINSNEYSFCFYVIFNCKLYKYE